MVIVDFIGRLITHICPHNLIVHEIKRIRSIVTSARRIQFYILLSIGLFIVSQVCTAVKSYHSETFPFSLPDDESIGIGIFGQDIIAYGTGTIYNVTIHLFNISTSGVRWFVEPDTFWTELNKTQSPGETTRNTITYTKPPPENTKAPLIINIVLINESAIANGSVTFKLVSKGETAGIYPSSWLSLIYGCILLVVLTLVKKKTQHKYREAELI